MTDSKLPEQRDIKTESGNYSEHIGKNYIQAGTVHIYEKSDCSATNTATQNVISKKQLTFVLTGTIGDVDKAKLRAIQAHLRKISGDAELTIIDTEEGSIRLKLEGSPEGLNKIEELFKSGELTEVLGIPVEDVQLVPNDTQEENYSIPGDKTSDNKICPDPNIEKSLNIEQTTYIAQNGSTIVVLEPSGVLDASTAKNFRLFFNEFISEHISYIIVNLGQVTYIDSSGLVELVSAFKITQASDIKMVICSINEQVKIFFELTGMDEVFEIFDTEKEAVGDTYQIYHYNFTKN